MGRVRGWVSLPGRMGVGWRARARGDRWALLLKLGDFLSAETGRKKCFRPDTLGEIGLTFLKLGKFGGQLFLGVLSLVWVAFWSAASWVIFSSRVWSSSLRMVSISVAAVSLD